MRKAGEKAARETITARKTPGRKIIVWDSAMSCPDWTDFATPSPDDPSMRYGSLTSLAAGLQE